MKVIRTFVSMMMLSAMSLVASAAWAQNDAVGRLFHAIEDNEFPIVRRLLQENPALVNTKNTIGLTPLYYATYYKHLDMMRLLLVRGANVNTTNQAASPQMASEYRLADQDGSTPLHLAAAHGDRPMIKLLLEYKANVNVRNANQETPLHLLANPRYSRSEDQRTMKTTLAMGALFGRGNRPNVNAQDKYGRTPLHNAAAIGNDNFISSLFDNNLRSKQVINFATHDNGGNTVFHLVVMSNNNDALRSLIYVIGGGNSKGLNLSKFNVANKDGYTPMDIAMKNQKQDIIQTLRRHGLKPGY